MSDEKLVPEDMLPAETTENEVPHDMLPEQYQSTKSKKSETKLPVIGNVADDIMYGTLGAITGSAVGPGIRAEVQAKGLPGLRPDVAPTGSLQSYLNTQLGTPKSSVTVEQLGKAVGVPIRTQSEVQDALRLLKGTEAQRVPVTKTINGVPTVVSYRDIPGKAPVDLSGLVKEAEAAAKPTSALGKAKAATEFVGDLTNKIISPTGLSVAGSRLAGALGGLDVGLQGTDMVQRAAQGDYGRAAISGLGALGGMAAMTRHPLVMPIGIGVSAAAPFINQYLDKYVAEHPEMFSSAKEPKHVKDILSLPKLQSLEDVVKKRAAGGAVYLAEGGNPMQDTAKNINPDVMAMLLAREKMAAMQNQRPAASIPVGNGYLSGNVQKAAYGDKPRVNVAYTLPFAWGGPVQK